ncbi:hypothetical protein GCM10010349_52460 [Streptomyces flavofungini]|nr:hypothetical protein GCM10010349_52460 [Streptomyces flavofungini]
MSVAVAPHTTNARVSTAVTPKTTRSVCGDRPPEESADVGGPPPASAFSDSWVTSAPFAESLIDLGFFSATPYHM